MQTYILKFQQLFFWMKANPKLSIAIFIVLFGFTRCHHGSSQEIKQNEVITVESHNTSNSLFYSGTIQPLKTLTVVSPADGVIEDMPFHYGDTVTAGNLLFTINSEKFQTDYKNALVQYVKARSELNNNQTQLSQGKFLHDNKLISDDELKIRKTNFYNAQLAFVQAKDVLGKMLKQLNISNVNLFDLGIGDIDKINSALHMQDDQQKLKIISPGSGMALLPLKSDSNGSEKKISKGEQVKQGDILAVIGDGQGLSVHINVSEFDIGQIKVGQHVKVTGSAFPDFTLEGTVTGVDHEAQVNQSGMPNFSADVAVPKLTEEEKKKIYIGMSAKVEIDVENPAEILIPIKAVTEKNGATFVKLQDPKTKKTHDVAVKTGKTTLDSVVILANLKVGDKILVPH